ncbi:UNVERIFIED_ORG: type I restriction enzyme S subunit [Pseudomonas putida]|nr:type I restriction enzyme S subunit [Pseudomonas putida]
MKSVPLGDIATLVRGVSFSKEEGSLLPLDGHLPVIRAGSIQGSLLLSEGQIWVPANKIKNIQRVRIDDIVMCTSSGSSSLVGKCARSTEDFDGSFGAFCAGIRADQEKVSPSYLYHFLCSPVFKGWTSVSSGANIKNIRFSELAEFKVPLPPLHEQKRIAAILDKADGIRRKRQHAIELVDDFLRTVFLEMFGDPVTNPKKFKTRFLGEFYIDGKSGTKCGPFGSALKKDEYTENGVPIWGMDNITLNGEFIDAPSQWVSEEKYRELESYSLNQGDVIISRAGTVGKMGVVRSVSQRSLISTNLIRVRFGDSLLPEYFVSLMTYCKGRVGRLKVGPDGAFTHMNVGVLDTLEFPYPPVQLQEKYLDIKRKVVDMLKKEVDSNKSLACTFDSLSQKAFSGQL